MRNVQDVKDSVLATGAAVVLIGIASMSFAVASSSEEAPVAPATSIVDVTRTVDNSGGVIKSEVSGGSLAKK